MSITMHNPMMYEKYISFQKVDSLYCLKKFSGNLMWRMNSAIVDLGCGDGSVTVDVLMRFIPEDFKSLTGLDISKEMVEHAKKKYGNSKIQFEVMDLAGEVNVNFIGAFDHAFSSYAIQFIIDQETAFQNFYKLLKDGGNCLLLFIGANPIYSAYISLSKKAKWRNWLQKINSLVRYQFLKDTQEEQREVYKIMEGSGFKDIHVEVTEAIYEYKSYEDLIRMSHAANLFQLPLELLNELMDEFRHELWETKCLAKVEGNPRGAIMSYHRIVAFGRK